MSGRVRSWVIVERVIGYVGGIKKAICCFGGKEALEKAELEKQAALEQADKALQQGERGQPQGIAPTGGL